MFHLTNKIVVTMLKKKKKIKKPIEIWGTVGC